MFTYISEKTVNRLIKKNVIDENDYEIYQYGLEQFFTTILNITTVVVIGFLFGELWQGLLFVIAFMALRSYAGGYHEPTPIRCYLLTTLIIALSLSAIKYIKINTFACVGLLVMSGIVILLFSPSESANKPLDDIEYIIYRRKALVIWFVEISIAVIFLFLNYMEVARCIVMSHLVLSVAIMLNRLRMKKS